MNHSQDLRDSVYTRRRYAVYKRGWINERKQKPLRFPFRWEINVRKRPELAFRLSCRLGGEDPREVSFSVGAIFFSFYLTIHNLLPERWAVGWYKRGEIKNPRWDIDSHGREFGFYLADKALVLMWNKAIAGSRNWNKESGYQLFFWLPWDWGACVRSEVMNEHGKLVPACRDYKEPYSDGRKIFRSPYTYVRKNGEVQKVEATYWVEEREWRWRAFHWLPFLVGPKKIHRSISVSFSGEVGEGTGSWKGGTVGCGYDLYPNEAPWDCLKRMEQERKFER